MCFAKCIPTLHPSRRTYFHSSLREEEGGKCQVEEEHEEEDEEEDEEEKEEGGVSALHVTGSMSWEGGGWVPSVAVWTCGIHLWNAPHRPNQPTNQPTRHRLQNSPPPAAIVPIYTTFEIFLKAQEGSLNKLPDENICQCMWRCHVKNAKIRNQ